MKPPTLQEINPTDSDAVQQYKDALQDWIPVKKQALETVRTLLVFQSDVYEKVIQVIDAQQNKSRFEAAIWLNTMGKRAAQFQVNELLELNVALKAQVKTLQIAKSRRGAGLSEGHRQVGERDSELKRLRRELAVVTQERDTLQATIDDFEILARIGGSK